MPVEGEGNARVEGSWRLKPAGTGARVQLHTKGALDVDFPGFLQFFLSPLIELAFVQKMSGTSRILKRRLQARSSVNSTVHCPVVVCHCEERSDVAIQSFLVFCALSSHPLLQRRHRRRKAHRRRIALRNSPPDRSGAKGMC